MLPGQAEEVQAGDLGDAPPVGYPAVAYHCRCVDAKGSHTAVAIGAGEQPLGKMRVPACRSQAVQLVAWAQAWPGRAWAVEGAAGLGHLLAQQLVAAGETVLDVPPKLAARVRLLEAGDTSKNDPNDALSVAVAALRSRAAAR